MKNVLTLCLLFVCCLCVNAQATTYFVNNTHANRTDSAGHVATDSTAPWGLAQSACSVAVAGDTVFFAPGTYDEDSPLGDLWAYNVTLPGGPPTPYAFRRDVNVGLTPYGNGDTTTGAYPDATGDGTLVFKGYSGKTRPNFVGSSERFGSVLTAKNLIVFDSLHFSKFYHGIFLNAGRYDSIKNCEINDIGYLAHAGSNGGAIFVDGNGAKGNVVGLYVGGNEIHDVWPDNDLDNVLDTGQGSNASALHIYYGDSMHFEYNHIYDCAFGIFPKGTVEAFNYGHTDQWNNPNVITDSAQAMFNVEINHNYIHDCITGGVHVAVQGQVDSLLIHHNILRENGVDIRLPHWYSSFYDVDWTFTRDVYIYNNTSMGATIGSPAYGSAGIYIGQGTNKYDTVGVGSFRPGGLVDNVQVFNNLGLNYTTGASPPYSFIQYPMNSHLAGTGDPAECGETGFKCEMDTPVDSSGISNFFEGYNAAWSVGNFMTIGDNQDLTNYTTSALWKANVPVSCTDCGTGDTLWQSNPVSGYTTGDVRLLDSTTYLSTGGRGGNYSDTIGANWNAADIFTIYAGVTSCAFTHSLVARDTQQNSIAVENFYTFDTDSGATADSVFLIWDDDNSIVSPLGSAIDSTGLGSPDTLTATGLTNGTVYYLWWVTYNGGCGADTSGYITLSTVVSEGSTSNFNGGVPLNGGTTLYFKQPEVPEQ